MQNELLLMHVSDSEKDFNVYSVLLDGTNFNMCYFFMVSIDPNALFIIIALWIDIQWFC